MTLEIAHSLEFISKELAPLPQITKKQLPANLSEEDALKAFFVLLSGSCPQLIHFPEYGFGLSQVRNFLSAFAGHKLELPSKRVLARHWEEFQMWLSYEQGYRQSKDKLQAIQNAAARFSVPERKIEMVIARYQAAQNALKKTT